MTRSSAGGRATNGLISGRKAGIVYAMREDRESFYAANDPGFFFKREASERGFAACAAFPLKLAKKKRGVLVIYGDALDFFQSEEVKVLSSLADHITFAIESLHNARERELLLSVLEERTAQLERTERRLSLLDRCASCSIASKHSRR